MRYQSNNELSAELRPDGRGCGFARKETSDILIAGAGWVWVLVTGSLWSVQKWQRPWITNLPDDRMWLVLSCVGLLALMVFPWKWHSIARLVCRVVVVFVCGALLLVGLRVYCEDLAVRKLESMIKADLAMQPWGSRGSLTAPSTTLSEKFGDLLEKIGVGNPEWLRELLNNQDRERISPADKFLAMSRLPVRMRVADAMVRDGRSALHLMAFWREYFPAIAGQDVTLECRHEWLRQLEVLRKESGHTLPTRQACLLMMALIVLTDPPEFEPWRGPVRDGMIHLKEEFVLPGAGHRPDFWYRTLDALLALDPPALWATLTRPMVVEGRAFQQAMEIPVRGLAGSLDAFVPVFENCLDSRDRFFLWQGMGASLEEHPEACDGRTAEHIRTWRRDTLFRWMMALGDGSVNDLTQIDNFRLSALDQYPAIPLNEDQQAQVVSAAEIMIGKIEKALEAGQKADANDLIRIRHVWPYLSEENADALCQRFAPILLQPEKFVETGKRSPRFDAAWVENLWFCRSRLTDEQQLLLRDRLSPLMANLAMMSRQDIAMLYADIWSKYPALSREYWLLMAWARGIPWKIHAGDTPPDIRPSEDQNVYLVPEISEETVDSLAGHLAFALQPHPDKGFEGLLSERLDTTGNGIRNSFFVGRLRNRLKHLGIHSGVDPVWLRKVLKSDLALMGLYRINAEIAEEWMDRLRSRNILGGRFLHSHDMADLFWGDVLENPARAAHAVSRCFGEEFNGELLDSLILCMERSTADEEVIDAVWAALMARTYEGENKRQAYGALFRISHLVGENKREAMRGEYMRSPPDEWPANKRSLWGQYYTSVHYDMTISKATLLMEMGFDDNPLAYPGGGIGIPWESDALSARDSWKTTLGRQLHPDPKVKISAHESSVFAYLSQGFDLERRDDGMWNCAARITLSATPFPPTPWQKARDLHRKRPDLVFP